MIKVLGIKILDRIKEAGLTQGILSRHASVITTRLGFHEVTDEICSREAYIILHLSGNPVDSGELKSELEMLGGVLIREIEFTQQGENQIIGPNDDGTEILCILVGKDPEIILTVQKLLTAFGCNIRTRLGVNEIFFGEPAGLIILELKGDLSQRSLLEKGLKALTKVQVRGMLF